MAAVPPAQLQCASAQFSIGGARRSEWSLLVPARIEPLPWLQEPAPGVLPLAAGSPAKVLRSGAVLTLACLSELLPEVLAEGLAPPPGLEPIVSPGRGSACAALKPQVLGRGDVGSEAETCCSGSGQDAALSRHPSLGGSSESAGSSSAFNGGSSDCTASLEAPSRSGTPSEGSAFHDVGDCRPCAWYWKASGCENAAGCRFCHMCSQGEVKSRKKSKLAAMRQARGISNED